MFKQLFTAHPKSIGETYGQHLKFATACGLKLVGAGVACIIHGIIPRFFPETASRTIEVLQQEILARKNSRADAK